MSDMIVRLRDFDSVGDFEHWAYQEILRYRMKSDELEHQLVKANEKVAELEHVFLSSPLTVTLLPNGESAEVYTVIRAQADAAIERSE